MYLPKLRNIASIIVKVVLFILEVSVFKRGDLSISDKHLSLWGVYLKEVCA